MASAPSSPETSRAASPLPTPQTVASNKSRESGFSEISTRYEPTTPGRLLQFQTPSSEVSTPASEVIRRAVSAKGSGATTHSEARLDRDAGQSSYETETPLRFGNVSALSALSTPQSTPSPSRSKTSAGTSLQQPTFEASLCAALQSQLALSPSGESSSSPQLPRAMLDSSGEADVSFHSARQSTTSDEAAGASPSTAFSQTSSFVADQSTADSLADRFAAVVSVNDTNEKGATPTLDATPLPPAEKSAPIVVSLLSDDSDEDDHDDDGHESDSDFVLDESAEKASVTSWAESPIQVPTRSSTQLRRRAARQNVSMSFSTCANNHASDEDENDESDSNTADAKTLSAAGLGAATAQEDASPSTTSPGPPLPPSANNVSASEFDNDSPLPPPKSTVKRLRKHKRVVFLSSSSEDEGEDIDLYDTSGGESEEQEDDDEQDENLAGIANMSLGADSTATNEKVGVRKTPKRSAATKMQNLDAYDLEDSFIASEEEDQSEDEDEDEDEDYQVDDEEDDDDDDDDDADSEYEDSEDENHGPRTSRKNKSNEEVVSLSSSDNEDLENDNEDDAAASLSRATAAAAREAPTQFTSVPDHVKITRANQDRYTQLLVKEFSAAVFDNKIPADIEVTWNPRMTKSAGYTYTKTKDGERRARIVLSTKVLTTGKRLNTTLLHELCHVAAWIVDSSQRPPHGRVFAKWATRATEAFPQYKVTTLHSYKVHAPFRYSCSTCQSEWRRHSKSIDVDAQVCGRCSGRLVFLGEFDEDGNKKAARKKTAYQIFVQENYSTVQKELGLTNASSVMKVLAERWRAAKADGAGPLE
ncbi:HMG box-containing protein C19G7.04 [Hondaea fermentalgiana]|uniref:HMG box-containing protein C19G7.04 n=1 Tax=Hondaea fermentalgiana TaxID=2315210 RepID=A0A2R5GI93_9STRA|nr:HMG box-containing protein C19G7.04 [Hondaea fermentalgiana]|eukprot:GBG30607.1 HMG box-containing protein C19G7.04 [Hondaea fermentalgiana]